MVKFEFSFYFKYILIVCIFAYGQTSSGKTFTMKGTKESPGIIPQTIAHIFNKMVNKNVNKLTKNTLNNSTTRINQYK